jgi:hypothetical protein
MKTPDGFSRKYRVVDLNGNISSQFASGVSAREYCNSMNGLVEINDPTFYRVIQVFVKKS